MPSAPLSRSLSRAIPWIIGPTPIDSGALGFFDETGDRPEVQSLHVTLIKKGATRTAVASLP